MELTSGKLADTGTEDDMDDNKEGDAGERYEDDSNLAISTVISHIINEKVPVALTVSADGDLNSSTDVESHDFEVTGSEASRGLEAVNVEPAREGRQHCVGNIGFWKS